LAEATPSSWGFRWFTGKPLGSLVDPQSQDRRTEDGGAIASDPTDRWVPVQRSPETLKRRTRVGIAKLVSRLSKFTVVGHPSDGAKTKTSSFTLKGHVSLVS
jgi:hypothetical protein